MLGGDMMVGTEQTGANAAVTGSGRQSHAE